METFATLKQYQMRLNPSFREILGIHGVLERNRNKPGESASHNQYGIAQDRQGSPEAHRKDRNFKQVRL